MRQASAGPAHARFYEPPYPVILWRPLRYSPENGEPFPNGTDILALRNPDGTCRFWFREWTWNGTWQNRSRPVSREEAARFIRQELEKPKMPLVWNHRAVRVLLPELWGPE
jgi:hypothetical protein